MLNMCASAGVLRPAPGRGLCLQGFDYVRTELGMENEMYQMRAPEYYRRHPNGSSELEGMYSPSENSPPPHYPTPVSAPAPGGAPLPQRGSGRGRGRGRGGARTAPMRPGGGPTGQQAPPPPRPGGGLNGPNAPPPQPR